VDRSRLDVASRERIGTRLVCGALINPKRETWNAVGFDPNDAWRRAMKVDFIRSYDATTTASKTLGRRSDITPRTRLRCVVAIPAKDEEERLTACLAALAEQIDRSGRPLDRESFGIVVFANNSADRTAELARALARRLSLRLRVAEVTLPRALAHAGGARGGAMDAAAEWLEAEGASDGVILTTDADSRVSPLWIASNLAAIDSGADAVLGDLLFDWEGDPMPAELFERGRLESAYEALLDETSALVDPLPHDPWPRHAMIAGASLATTLRAYRRVGGLPRAPLGEDKAFIAALARIDAKVRHSPDVFVTTSGRWHGRAPGGVADTLRLRRLDPAAPCDEALESYRVAFARAKWKRRLRRWRRSRATGFPPAWARALRIARTEGARAAESPTFGEAWVELERISPRLARRPLTPAELPGQIATATRVLARLRAIDSDAGEPIEPKFGMPIGEIDLRERLHARDEEFGGLVAG
jgi:hypothetical protein